MIVGGLLLLVRPQSLTFVWFEVLFGVRYGLLAAVGVTLLISCGFALALQTDTSPRAFGLLTLPIAGFGGLVTVFALVSDSASILPGYFSFLLWVVLQIAHDLTGVIRRWSHSSNPSSRS